MSLAALETPAAVVDLDALVANIDGVLAAVRAATPPGHTVRVRPHAKSHKCAQLALLQAQRSGGLTTGVCAQKVREAEALVRGGVVDVLLSNEVVDGRKLARLAGLAAGGATIRVLVDDADNAAAVSRAAVAARTTLGVLVEVDVGQRRCGVTGPAEAVALAAVIANLPGVRLDGIQCYHGAAQHVRSVAGRRAMGAQQRRVVLSGVTVSPACTNFSCDISPRPPNPDFGDDAVTIIPRHPPPLHAQLTASQPSHGPPSPRSALPACRVRS